MKLNSKIYIIFVISQNYTIICRNQSYKIKTNIYQINVLCPKIYKLLIDIINILKINYKPPSVEVICCPALTMLPQDLFHLSFRCFIVLAFSNAYNMNFIFIFLGHIQLMTTVSSI